MVKEQMMTVDSGLAGVSVCSSQISCTTVDEEGIPILLYRGYSIYDLVKGPFEEGVFLLLNGKLPNQEELAEFSGVLRSNRKLDDRVIKCMQGLPKNAHMMDILVSTLSIARMFDEDYETNVWQSPKADVNAAADLIKRANIRMGPKIATIMANGYRIKHGLNPIPPDDNLSFAANILHMLGIPIEDELVSALNTSLILYLDHTMNNSTFTVRVVESTSVDPYSPPMAAIAALKGARHGGATEMTVKMIDEIESPDKAEKYILDKLSRKDIISGFGHRLAQYKGNVESRIRILEPIARGLAEKKGMNHLFEIYDVITAVMKTEKNRAQNIDLTTGILYKILGIPVECNTPIFAASRYFGWVAHMIEQRLANGPLFRPDQQYTGPKLDEVKEYVQLEKR